MNNIGGAATQQGMHYDTGEEEGGRDVGGLRSTVISWLCGPRQCVVPSVCYSWWDIFIVGEASDIVSLKGGETKPGLCLLCVLNNSLVAPALSIVGGKCITERYSGARTFALLSGVRDTQGVIL